MLLVDYTAPAPPGYLMSVLPEESGVAQGVDWRWTRQRWMRRPWQESALSPPMEAGLPISPELAAEIRGHRWGSVDAAAAALTDADLAAIADELDALADERDEIDDLDAIAARLDAIAAQGSGVRAASAGGFALGGVALAFVAGLGAWLLWRNR